jgi:hypothetical protein
VVSDRVHSGQGRHTVLEEELLPCIQNISSTSYIKITSGVEFIEWITPEWVWCDQTHTILHTKQNYVNNIVFDIVYAIGSDVINSWHDF